MLRCCHGCFNPLPRFATGSTVGASLPPFPNLVADGHAAHARPDGLDPELKTSAHAQVRLSSLTLPHALARVLLAEQLYRAWSMLANHPYHRA